MLKKLDIYIIKKYLSTFFFTMLLISMIAVVIDFSEKVNKFMDSDLSFLEILRDYYIPFVPWINGLMWPLFALISVVFFTSRMAKNSEIIAILSAGVSARRLMVPYLISAMIISIALWFGKNHLIPLSSKKKNDFEYEYITKKHNQHLHNDIHIFLNPSEKIYIRYYSKRDTTGQGFRLETFKEGRLTKYIKAEKLKLIDRPNKWSIINYEIRSFNKLDEDILLGKGEQIDTILDLTAKDFVRNKKLMQNMTSADLKDYILREKERGLGTAKNFLVELHQRTADPFTILVLTIIGFAISSRKVRGGMGFHLAIGVITGSAYVVLSQFAATFSINMSLDPGLGAWIPNLLFGCIALIMLYKAQQ